MKAASNLPIFEFYPDQRLAGMPGRQATNNDDRSRCTAVATEYDNGDIQLLYARSMHVADPVQESAVADIAFRSAGCERQTR